MFKLLVNSTVNGQEIVYVDQTGQYFDPTRIVWDERTDGPIPAIELGKMQRVDGQLETSPDYLPEHAQYLADKQNAQQVVTRVNTLRQSMLSDTLVMQLRGMTDAEIDTWCDANITDIADLRMLLNKIIKILIAMNEVDKF